MSGGYRTPAMRTLRITAGPFTFTAALEERAAPKTVAAIRRLLPLRSKVIHCRWSGESTWVPMGEQRLDVAFENHTSHPAPGQMLVYPGGISEMEFLFPYGATLFSSKVGKWSARPGNSRGPLLSLLEDDAWNREVSLMAPISAAAVAPPRE